MLVEWSLRCLTHASIGITGDISVSASGRCSILRPTGGRPGCSVCPRIYDDHLSCKRLRQSTQSFPQHVWRDVARPGHSHLSGDRGHGHGPGRAVPELLGVDLVSPDSPRRNFTAARCSRYATVLWFTPSSAPIRGASNRRQAWPGTWWPPSRAWAHGPNRQVARTIRDASSRGALSASLTELRRLESHLGRRRRRDRRL
jgi:hypothetical protein